MRHAACEDVVVGAVLLDHQPGPADDVPGKRPVADRIEIAQRQLLLEPERDRGGAACDPARDELLGPALGLVVVDDPRAGVQPVVLAQGAHQLVRGELGDPVGRGRPARRLLALGAFRRVAEDRAGRRREQAHLGVGLAHRLQDRRARAGDRRRCLGGPFPGDGHERRPGKVVDLAGTNCLDR